VIDGPFNISEDDPAVTSSGEIELTLNRTAVETPREDIRVLHSPRGNNWTFLQTNVTAQEEDLVLEATPVSARFGTVAVVDDSNVQFVWSGDLGTVGGPANSVPDANSIGTTPSIATVGGVGVGVPTASILMSAGNSELINRIETAAGISDQIEAEGPTGFTIESMSFDEPGSKEINVTLVDADGRTAVGTTTITVVDSSAGSDGSSDGADVVPYKQTDESTAEDEDENEDEGEDADRSGGSEGPSSAQSDEPSNSGDSSDTSVSGADLFDQVDIPGGASVEIPETVVTDQSTSPQQLLIPGLISLMGILGSVVGYRTISMKGILSRLQRNPRIVEVGRRSAITRPTAWVSSHWSRRILATPSPTLSSRS
jgi:hypothetical protein